MLIYPVVSAPKRVPAGSIVTVACETRTAAGVLTTPGTSIKVRIYEANGTVAQALTAMTTASAGVHSYNYATVTTKAGGEYLIEIEAVHTDGTTLFRSKPGMACNFEVE